jgi:predicted DNA-binding transcriptional regulator AlpA
VTTKMLRILRKRQVLELIPIGQTKLEEDFIKTGRLKKIPLGERAIGFAEENVQSVIAELIAAASADTPEIEPPIKQSKQTKRRASR